jgi:hypothetical protein
VFGIKDLLPKHDLWRFNMRVIRSSFFVMMFLMMGTLLFAQSAQNTPAAPSAASATEPALPSLDQIPGIPPGSRPVTHGPQHDRRCWRDAGIAPAKVNERWKIEDGAKVRINEVCSQASLTPEKKRQRILQINQETQQEIAKIIPEQQLTAFNACEAKREQENAKHPGPIAQKQLGPCGGILPAEPESGGHSHEHASSMPSNQ